jgi:hypothetical protein
MPFDMMNAVLFKVLADRKDVQDSNKIMVVAGMATGSPLNKMIGPMLMVQQAEESRDKDKTIARLQADAAAAGAKPK